MTQNHSQTLSAVQSLLGETLSVEEAGKRLTDLGYDEVSVEECIKEFKRLKYAKRQNIGFGLVGIGALLGFISCVLTMINPIPELCDFFLYGLTSIAIVIVFAGLYCVFE